MASYNIETYLLDRANIHDVVTKMSLYLDMKKFSEMVDEAFAEEITVDYTSLFGGEPYQIKAEKQVKTWQDKMKSLDSWQHINTSLLIDMPQPGVDVEIPDKAHVIANAIVNLRRASAMGDPEFKNGGRYEFDVVRTKKVGNPWRISMLKADVVWISGNNDVMKEFET